MPDFLLELKDVHINYAGVEAVRGVSMKVRRYDFVTVIGANGAGKSSIFNAISGIVRPSKGEIWFDNERIDNLSPPDIAVKGVTQVPEGRKIFQLLTVKENLLVGAFLQKNKRKVAGNLERVYNLFPALKEKADTKGIRLSGGQQQMLAIGRAIMADPKLMLLDEPSLGLSPIFCKHLEEQLKVLHQEGLTLLLVEQNAAMGLGMANYGYVLENGELRKEGASASLLEDDEVKTAYLGV